MHESCAVADFHVRFVFVCPEARLRLRLNALAFIQNWCTHSQLCFKSMTKHLICQNRSVH